MYSFTANWFVFHWNKFNLSLFIDYNLHLHGSTKVSPLYLILKLVLSIKLISSVVGLQEPEFHLNMQLRPSDLTKMLFTSKS